MDRDDFEDQLSQFIHSADYTPALPMINEIVKVSIYENFQTGGRYGDDRFGGGKNKWEPSARAIEQHGQTLLDTGQLVASTRVKSEQRGSGIVIEVGSNKNYAKKHHFGIKQKTRPIYVLQDEDIIDIRDLILETLGI